MSQQKSDATTERKMPIMYHLVVDQMVVDQMVESLSMSLLGVLAGRGQTSIDAVLAEADRRADLFHERYASSAVASGHPRVNALRSVFDDVSRGFL